MPKVYTRKEFAAKYSPFINAITKGTGLHTGTVIAQAIIESQGKIDGTWMVGGSQLSQKANNYFGIKCHGWKGRTYHTDTGEYTPSGEYYIDEGECFRAYDSVEDSILDHLQFLQKNQRYTNHGVFRARDVKEQAQALKSAGYATNPDYAGLIENVYNGVKPHISTKIAKLNSPTRSSKTSLTKKDKAITISLVSIGAVGLIVLLTLLIKSGSKN